MQHGYRPVGIGEGYRYLGHVVWVKNRAQMQDHLVLACWMVQGSPAKDGVQVFGSGQVKPSSISCWRVGSKLR
ncbi:hypothetical protein ACFXTH_019809 [Malus domestica]